MTDHPTRLFASDAAVRALGEAFLERALPKVEWTHEAHLATCLWLIAERPEVHPERDLQQLIRAYNESVGGVSDDTQGYHETLTRLYIRGVRAFSIAHADGALVKRVNALLVSETGQRDWPLRFYSRETLFSVAARRGWIEPDLAPIEG